MTNILSARSSRVTLAEERVGVTFENGLLTLNGIDLAAGLEITAYVGAYTVSRAPVLIESGLSVARLNVDDFPNVEYPIEIRFAESGAGKEVCPPFPIKDLSAALRHLGADEMSAMISGMDDESITFELQPTKLLHHPRTLFFRVNGQVISEGTSVPPPPRDAYVPYPAQPHTLCFSMGEPLSDGAVLELVDVTSGEVVFSRVATWLNLAGGMMRGMRQLTERLSTLESTVMRLDDQFAKMSREIGQRLLLERLDLFYSLIQNRMDRELRALDAKTAPPVPLPARGQPQDDVVIDAAGIEGVGIYHLEVEGERQWRWLSPRTSLVFRDVPSTCKAVRLEFSTVPVEMDVDAIDVRVNTRRIDVALERTDDSLKLTLPFDPAFFASARMAALIVELEFPHRFQPAGDSRVLSAAFASATICF